MKRLIVFTLCLLLVGFAVSAKNDKDKDKNMVNLGTYSIGAGDFEAKFWKEMFKGGGPGQPGNTLMAVGEGLIFKHAVLESVGVSTDLDYQWITTYVGGMLTLNSSGPWLNKGKLRDTAVLAMNDSKFDEDTGHLEFHLVFGGQFDDTGYFYRVDAWYQGEPRIQIDDEGNWIFHRDNIFKDIIIQIAEEPIDGVPSGGGGERPGKVNYGTYSTCDPPDFNTKFWKEMFKGGGPGQPGNVLKAIGDGFVFKHAVLEGEGALTDPDYQYATMYVGGKLTLNSSGPWLNKGQLRARDITAHNFFTWDKSGDLHFELRFEGMFEDTGIYFQVLAWYDGQPEMKGWGNTSYEFQRGTDFHAKIIISATEITEALTRDCNGIL